MKDVKQAAVNCVGDGAAVGPVRVIRPMSVI